MVSNGPAFLIYYWCVILMVEIRACYYVFWTVTDTLQKKCAMNFGWFTSLAADT